MVQKRWKILPYNAEKVHALQSALKIAAPLCKILTQRDIDTYDKAKNYFRPQMDMLHDPWLMKDMDKAVSRILSAISNGEGIFVFGDYDVDGTTAVACIYQFLGDIYDPAKLEFYIPHRYREGYGLSKQGIDQAAANGHSLIIMLDCGIKSVELIKYAAGLGIDCIVCDHHLPGNELPPAVAILNPKQAGCVYPYKELCGCGVGFKLISALAGELHLPAENSARFLDLVATAIAADIVPMTGENRVLAYFGLERINHAPCPGIKALIQLSGINQALHITNVVFAIAPRVNAAGRMDDATKAVQLFAEKDFSKALVLAEMLHHDNTDRKEADSNITAEALEILNADPLNASRKSSVLYKEHWHKGVVGIVASRLIEQHYRPTVVLTQSGGLATGSARSVVGFNLYEAIYECRELLTAYGGHFAAAGLSLKTENIPAFREKFEAVVAASIPPHLLEPEIVIDSEIGFPEIKDSLYQIIGQMEPFGPENMRPVFIAKKVSNTPHSRIVKENHIRFVLQQEDKILTGIGFNLAHKFPLLQGNQPLDIVFTIDENEWQGNKSLQLKMIDFRISES
jgi:single-stranded-DNA-specific exonuclease